MFPVKPRFMTRLLSVAALGCLISGTLSATHAREFRAADNQVAGYPTVEAIEYMGRLINDRTQGRHKIKLFHSAQLGEETDTISQTQAGIIDINRVSVAPLSNIIPELRTLGLPFLFHSQDHFHSVLDGLVGEEILASFTRYGFVGLTFYDSGARSIYNSRGPIRTLADINGLRIRVQQSEISISMMKALGADPIALSYGQVKTGLATGLINGAENNWPSYVSTGHFRNARYYTLTEHTRVPEVLIMSRTAWDTLSPEDQNIFRAAARESGRYMRGQWQAWEQRSREEALAEGVEVTTDFDRAAMVAAVAPVYDAAQKDPAIAKLVERIKLVP